MLGMVAALAAVAMGPAVAQATAEEPRDVEQEAALLSERVSEFEERIPVRELQSRSAEDAEDREAADAERLEAAAAEHRPVRAELIQSALVNLDRSAKTLAAGELDHAALATAEENLREATADADQHGPAVDATLLHQVSAALVAVRQDLSNPRGADVQSALQRAEEKVRAARGLLVAREP